MNCGVKHRLLLAEVRHIENGPEINRKTNNYMLGRIKTYTKNLLKYMKSGGVVLIKFDKMNVRKCPN